MSQLYLLPCPCGQKVRIANAQAGGQVMCACGKSLSVPTLRGIRELEIAPPEAPTKSGPGWSPAHGIVFAVALVVAAVGLTLLAFYGLKYAQIDKRFTQDYTEHYVKAEQARIEKLTPVDALTEWSEALKEGLGEKDPPPWIAVKQLVTKYQSWMKGGAITLIAGILVAATTLFVGRK